MIERVKERIAKAEAIVIGAGAGLSTAAGLSYSGERFQRLFPDFIEKYALRDMYSSAFYPFKTPEEFWAYFSRHIYYNRYEQELDDTYANLLKLVQDKEYFVITTNVDHVFQKSGFDKEKLFYMQGDYGLLQCSVPCHDVTYDNKELVYEMVARQKDCKIPSDLVPYCPRCGKEMTTNLRKDGAFVQDAGWFVAAKRYEDCMRENAQKDVLFLELGVGYNTPGIIKFPFWQMTSQNKEAFYVSVNMSQQDLHAPKEIEPQSTLVQKDISHLLKELV